MQLMSTMMKGEEHCAGCPSDVMPIAQDSHCTQCIPWVRAQMFVAMIQPVMQIPYPPYGVLPAWAYHQSLPWKPPRNAVLNG